MVHDRCCDAVLSTIRSWLDRQRGEIVRRGRYRTGQTLLVVAVLALLLAPAGMQSVAAQVPPDQQPGTRPCTMTTNDPVVRGTSGADVICLGDGDHVVDAGSGDDEVRGGDGRDVIEGGD